MVKITQNATDAFKFALDCPFSPEFENVSFQIERKLLIVNSPGLFSFPAQKSSNQISADFLRLNRSLGFNFTFSSCSQMPVMFYSECNTRLRLLYLSNKKSK